MWQWLRRSFIAGLFVTVPLVVSVVAIVWVFRFADRISVLVYGEIIASDAPQKIRGNKAVQEAYLGTEAAA